MAQTVYADVEIQELSKVFDKFTVGGEVNLFYRYDSNPWFGGVINPNFSNDTDSSYGETFSRFRLTATKRAGWAEISGQLPPILPRASARIFTASTTTRIRSGLIKHG